MLASVAASDSELAARLHQVNVVRMLERVDAGLGFVFGELLEEILAIRQALDPSNRRAGRLSVLLAESEAMVVQSFAALGVDETIAATLAKDRDVGLDVMAPDGDVLVLTAVTGSGKTMTAIRSHQVNVVDAVLSAAAPIPVLVHTRALTTADLRDVVMARTRDIADVSSVGIRLVLDGLDEVSRSEAQRVLAEAAVLVSAWPSSSAVAFGRPDVPYNGVRTAQLQLPSPESLERIATSITGMASPFWGFSPSLRHAVQLPLFAIAASVLISRRREVPQSRAAIIEALVGVCLKDADVTDEGSLRRLAVELVRHGTVTEGTVGTAQAARLAMSRIVIRAAGQLRFAVPVYQDWFAAQALLVDGIAEEVVPTDAESFSRWRHVFALAMAVGPVMVVDHLASLLTARVPAGLRLVLDESTSGPSSPAAIPDAPTDAATRIDHCLSLTNRALALPLSAAGREAVDPTKSDVEVAGSWASIELRNRDGHPLRHWGTIIDSREPAWPWRLAASRVAKDLDDVVDRRLLHLDHPVVLAELVWAVARFIADDRSLLHRPIDPGQVLQALPPADEFPTTEPVVLVGRRKLWMRGDEVQHVIAAAVSAQEGGLQLVRPWPVPDNWGSTSGWTDDLYRPETAASFLRDVRIAALHIYECLVREWFSEMVGFLATFASLPVLNRCVYRPRKGSDWAATMWTKWFPLPVGSPSRVVFAVMEELPERRFDDARDEWAEGWRTAGRQPPPFTKAFSSSYGVVRGLFSDRPATHLAYRWLSHDLDTLKWREAMVPVDEPA